jgi:hypothetical protein
MLGKLIKHEWKATWKFPALISLFVVVLTFLGVLSFKAPFWHNLITGNIQKITFFDMAAFALLAMYFVYICIALYAIMIYFAIRFYKNMYTDEGYLSHTLPVKPSAHIFSKTLVSGTWYIGATVLMLVSMIWLLYAFMSTIFTSAGITSADMAELSALGLNFSLGHFAEAFNSISSMPFWVFVVLLIFTGIFSCYSSMLIIYVCISIGQLFKKHKVIASILTYLVVTTIMSTVLTIAMLPASFNMMLNGDYFALMESADPIVLMVAPYAMMAPMFIVSVVCTVVFSVVSYFITEFIMRRKLNLE